MPMQPSGCIGTTKNEENIMNIYVENKKIESLKIVCGEGLQVPIAANYFNEYAEKLGLNLTRNGDFSVNILLDKTCQIDSLSMELKKDSLTLRGGKRGVIYSVFSFLEILGCRFFTENLEYLPTGDVYLNEFYKEESTPFTFRDVCTNYANAKRWSHKQRLNSNLWNVRPFLEEQGGSCNFAGIPAHSLSGEYLLKPYVKTNPEFFSLIDGKRYTNYSGQICMSNDDAANAAAYEACKLLRENPDKNIVSVSQGDNRNFCQCDACRALVEKQGLVKTYFDVINKIARIIKKEHPHALVHTFAYEALCKKIDFPLEDNIMMQFCFSKCSTHAIDDESCDINKENVENLTDLCGKCKNVHVWYYVNCFKHQLFEYPYVHNMRRNIRFFADVGVTGIFNEGMHRSNEKVDCAETMELRSYVLAKLMWNPYMSEEEFRTHISEFCNAYYGKGGDRVVKYLALFEGSVGECAGYDHHIEIDGEYHPVCTVKKEDIPYIISESHRLLNEAYELAEGEQKQRVDLLRTAALYFEMYYTMDDIMENGTEEEKAIALEKNSKLIDRIIDQMLVLTFWGQWRRTQNDELREMRDVSPKNWNYKW